MKYIYLLFILVLFVGCSFNEAKDISNHPLNHKNFKIIDYPRSSWIDGCLYHTEVMEYLFKSENERNLAITKLLEAGYGKGKTDYLYINNQNISVNGKIYFSLIEAKKHIKDKNIKKILYTGTGIFPKEVPKEVKIDGVNFWLIDWKK